MTDDATMTNLGDSSLLDPLSLSAHGDQDGGDRRRRSVALVVNIGVAAVLTVVVLAQLALSKDGDNSREGETLTAQVTALSSSGRSLCIERAGSDSSKDTCGVPIALPDSKGQLTPGATVTVTELWLTTNDVTKFAWMVH